MLMETSRVEPAGETCWSRPATLACRPNTISPPVRGQTKVAAVAGGQAAAARALLAAGANPNLTSSGGRTPLIEAAIGGRVEIARMLIAEGANVNLAERGTGTPLEAAEREGHTAMAALLRSRSEEHTSELQSL